MITSNPIALTPDCQLASLPQMQGAHHCVGDENGADINLEVLEGVSGMGSLQE